MIYITQQLKNGAELSTQLALLTLPLLSTNVSLFSKRRFSDASLLSNSH